MAVTDISVIDTALYGMLGADATLAGFCPDGVHWDIGPQGAEAFVLLVRSPEAERSLALGGEDGWEKISYAITAVIKSGGHVVANNAAYRIHELLHHGTLAIAAGGYTLMLIERLFPIRFTETDPQNVAIKWQHYGGQYSVMVCPSNI